MSWIYCNKKYASYQSRSNHIKKYHNTNNIQNIQSDIYSDIQNKCNKCDKILSNYYSIWRHEKNCKEIKKDNIEIKEMKQKLKIMDNDITNKVQPKVNKFLEKVKNVSSEIIAGIKKETDSKINSYAEKNNETTAVSSQKKVPPFSASEINNSI